MWTPLGKRVFALWLCVLAGATGCGGTGAAATPDGGASSGGGGSGPGSGCKPGQYAVEASGCQEAGIPKSMGCKPGETPADGGACQPAGIPPAACAPGFMPANDACEPVLPATSCPKGQMAVPGDSACHEVAPCGAGPWGSAPIGAQTIFVDGSYAGSNSDGTMTKPWKTINQALAGAPSGAVIAIAAGTYSEFLLLSGKPVSLWGACPGAVEIHGTLADSAAIEIHAQGTEVHDLAVTGVSFGIAAVDVEDVVLDHVWVHDTPVTGVQAVGTPGTGVLLRGSLIEATGASGADAQGAALNVEGSLIRDVAKYTGDFGYGTSAWELNGTKARLSITGSVVERNAGAGLYGSDSDVHVDSSVIRDTHPSTTGSGLGRGIRVVTDSTKATVASLSLSSSVIENNYTAGVAVEGASLQMDSTLVSGTRALSSSTFAAAVMVAYQPASKRSADATITRSALVGNSGEALSVGSSSVTIAAMLIRDVTPGGIAPGWGVAVDDASGASELEMAGSLVTGATENGIIIEGSQGTLTNCAIRDTQLGDGASAVAIVDDAKTHRRSTVKLVGCDITHNYLIGIDVYGSDLSVDSTHIGDTMSTSSALASGVVLLDDGVSGERANAEIKASEIETTQGTGLSVTGSTASLVGTRIGKSQSPPDGLSVGVLVSDGEAGVEATLNIVGSVLQQNQFSGLAAHHSDVTIDSTAILDTMEVDGLSFGAALFSAGSLVTITRSEVRSSAFAGISVYSSDVTIEDTTISDVKAQSATTSYGDGIIVFSDMSPAKAELRRVQVSNTARAGLSNFGATITLDACTLTCNPIDIDGESAHGLDFSLTNAGDNICGCQGNTVECKVQSSALEPPPPAPDLHSIAPPGP